MPHTLSATMPTLPSKQTELKAQTLHASIAKKMKQCTVYSCTAIEKLSTKWKKQRRLLVATPSLLLVCTPECDVRRVIDFAEIDELVLQQDGAETLLLVKLMDTDAKEPDLLAVSSVDKRATHPPATFLDIVSVLVKQSRQGFAGVQILQSGGIIRSMARLGHNTVSAKEKLKLVAAKPPQEKKEELRRPHTMPPQIPHPMQEFDEPEGLRVFEDPLPEPPAHDDPAALPFQPKISSYERPEFKLHMDSRPTSDASGLTPAMNPLNFSSQSDAAAPLSPLGLSLGPLQNDFADDNDVIAASRMRAAGDVKSSSMFLPKFDEVQESSELGRRKPRSVSFTTPTHSNEQVASIVAQNRAAPLMRGVASSMPPVKSLPEDDEGGCGWTEHTDPVTQLPYYRNESIEKSTWQEPEELIRWKAKQQQGYGADPLANVSQGLGMGPAATSKRGILLQKQQQQRLQAQQESDDDDDDSASASEDSMMAPVPRGRGVIGAAGGSADSGLHGIARLLDGPPVKVTLPPRLPRNHTAPAFDEQPVPEMHSMPSAAHRQAPSSSAKSPIVGLKRYEGREGRGGNKVEIVLRNCGNTNRGNYTTAIYQKKEVAKCKINTQNEHRVSPSAGGMAAHPAAGGFLAV